MANEQNLTPFKNKREATVSGRKGGLKSAKVKKEKKTLQQILGSLLEMQAPKKISTPTKNGAGQIVNKDYLLHKKIVEMFPGIKPKDITNIVAIAFTLMKGSLKGNTNAAKELMDRAYGKSPQSNDTPQPVVKEIIYIDKKEKDSMKEHIRDMIDND